MGASPRFIACEPTLEVDSIVTMNILASLQATNLAESASLWAIRIAMILLVVCTASELSGVPRTRPWMVCLWLLGAAFATAHSFGSLFSFHHGSQSEAFASTAEQTQQLLGFRFGAGLYINYAFVVVWWMDALLRLNQPARYERYPKRYFYGVYGFLLFIAFNGTIVFKAGTIRWVGIASVLVLLILALRRRSRYV